GELLVENGTIADVLSLLFDQPEYVPRWAKLRGWLRDGLHHLGRRNWRRRSKDNVEHHYDLDGQLYSIFLDADKQYSCAYWDNTAVDLESAQLAKKRHLAAKLLLRPDLRLLA